MKMSDNEMSFNFFTFFFTGISALQINEYEGHATSCIR